MTGKERELAETVNAEYMLQDPVEDLLRKYFDLTEDMGDWTASVEILQTLQYYGLRGTTRGNAMALSATMRRLGLTKRRQGDIQGYHGVTKAVNLSTPSTIAQKEGDNLSGQ